MVVPHVVLTDTQYALLAELMLAPLPHLFEDVSVRRLSAEQLAGDVPALLWMRLIEECDGVLAITMKGAAVYYRAEHEKAECRLAEVTAFADVLEAEEGAPLEQRRICGALRRLAQGTALLEEAIGSVRTPA
ncbi:hypothetical protein [Streptomyces sp. NRRL_B-2557]|uniref:hypothetical protein n=1 Tax=Streptomyces sp. NRRL_B-2557 TaxID=3028698 RepID=UPI0029B2B568|nr:hypothetical protein [Streptomyces sp. NRRL_B-2557]MDX2748533.1 hypothetical protein [Streptomyces sp. NRRL_B-2557]